jgi:hypothetical protein
MTVEEIKNGDGSVVFAVRLRGGIVIAGETEEQARQRALSVLRGKRGKVNGRHSNAERLHQPVD